MSRDQVFSTPQHASDFQFDDRVASVFDDMVSRSVPFYHVMQGVLVQTANLYLEEEDVVWDLGCSTAATLHRLDRIAPESCPFYGIDSSSDMIRHARLKMVKRTSQRSVYIEEADFTQAGTLAQLPRPKVIIMALVLMFVRPSNRQKLLSLLAGHLRAGGVLLLAEKTLSPTPKLNRFQIDRYYALKRKRGYSELEITQKREALENVLVPFTIDENRQLLKDAGFKSFETLFQWYNFMVGAAF